MPKLNITDVRPFMDMWLDDKFQESKIYTVGRVVLPCTPDTLHLGHGTYAFAFKNRKAGFMVIPDFDSVGLPECLRQAEVRLSNCWTPLKELRKVETSIPDQPDWEWHDLPGLTWPIAPVDVMDPSLQHCDKATLQNRSVTVLQRWADKLMRRYARAKSCDLKGLDMEWSAIESHYTSLDMTIPANLQDKRRVSTAKARLINS